MRVLIIGAGRLGSVVTPLLVAAGFDARLVRRGDPIALAEVYWLTVRDAQLEELSGKLPSSSIQIHSAGALGPEALGTAVERAVLHPLMSFRPGGAAPAGTVHARVSGTVLATQAARRLCAALGWQAFEYHGDPVRYHAAACMVSGHVAALFLDAADLLVQDGLTPQEARARLLSLATESLRNVAELGDRGLTGPAVRGDITTIQAHEAALDEANIDAYRALSRRVSARTTSSG